MLIKKALTRRQILAKAGGTGAVTALMPFIPMVEAAEGDGTKKRFAYWHEFVMPQSGSVDPNYQQDYGPIRFREAYAPLNEMAEKLVFIRKMQRPQGQGKNGGPHPAGSHAISGWRYGGRTGGKITIVNNAAHSLDQFFAEKLEGTTPFSDLRAGFRNSGKNGVIDRSSSIKKGNPMPRYQDPMAMYNDVFKGASTPSSPGDDAAAQARLAQSKSILDFMRKDIARIEKEVSHIDKQRIEAHLESVRSTERKLEAQVNVKVDCSVGAPAGGAGGENKIYPIFSELMTQALACDMTRVAGACYGSATSTLNYNFLPSSRGANWHQSTHGKGGGAAFAKDVLNFRAAEVTRFLKLMDAVVEPNGDTLLDNTMFTWFTDVSRNHDTTGDIHCILAGAKGALQNHGQMVEASTNNKYNQLLGSMAHYMGYKVSGYGDPAYGGTGVLSEDLFKV